MSNGVSINQILYLRDLSYFKNRPKYNYNSLSYNINRIIYDDAALKILLITILHL